MLLNLNIICISFKTTSKMILNFMQKNINQKEEKMHINIDIEYFFLEFSVSFYKNYIVLNVIDIFVFLTLNSKCKYC